jgi:hypothetical protein
MNPRPVIGIKMIEGTTGKDQQHPLYNRDRPLIDILLAQEATDYNLAELARLRMRYQGFPGARDIQQDLDKVLQQWGLSEAELYERTRQIHHLGGIYKSRGKKDEQDWN